MKKKLKLCSFLLLGLVILLASSVMACAPSATPSVTPSVIEVTIRELFAAYEANPIAADLKYEDKIIRIKGEVWQISGGESPEVELEHEVQCSFDKKYLLLLAQLRKGQMVTVEGRLESCTIRIARLRDCILVSAIQPTSTIVTTVVIGFVIATSWDADPETDGIKVEIEPLNVHEVLVKAPGTVSAELWLQKDLSGREKVRLLQSWRTSVEETDYVRVSGAVVQLEYSGFVPGYDQWGTLELTFTTTDGKSFTSSWKNIKLQ